MHLQVKKDVLLFTVDYSGSLSPLFYLNIDSFYCFLQNSTKLQNLLLLQISLVYMSILKGISLYLSFLILFMEFPTTWSILLILYLVSFNVLFVCVLCAKLLKITFYLKAKTTLFPNHSKA